MPSATRICSLAVVLLVTACALEAPTGSSRRSGFGGTASLDDYWAGRADWVLDSIHAVNPGSFFLRIGPPPERAWYRFNRVGIRPTNAATCPGASEVGRMQVSKSTDRGNTWGPWTTFIDPNGVNVGTAWACDALDGDALFAADGKWHFLFQCRGTDDVWNGCHLQTDSPEPTSGWYDPGGNPVIRSGQLWPWICRPGTRCHQLAGGRSIREEGTFQIVEQDGGGGIYVGLHGYDGVNGYRGIVKTTRWTNWVAGDIGSGIPGDSIFDRSFSDPPLWREQWRGGASVGGGAGGIIRDGSHYYQVVESPDVNLAISRGQHWDIGILRAPSLVNSNWEQFPQQNPILYSAESGHVAAFSNNSTAYPRLFKDPQDGAVYLTFGRPAQSRVYVLRLAPNALKNGNGWKGLDAAPWKTMPASGPRRPNLAIYRDPEGAYAGNTYIAFNCGSGCDGGKSLYQDVSVRETGWASGRALEWGGMLRSHGATGTVHAAVWELDGNERVLRSHVIAVTLEGNHYASFTGTDFALAPGTVTLRYELYPTTPSVTFGLGESYLRAR